MRIPRVPSALRPRSPADGILDPPGPPDHAPGPPIHERPGFEFPIRDGRRVFLSPVLPEDRRRLEAGFDQLSDRSRLFRFFRERDRLTEEEIRRFTEADQVDHVAWCALDTPDPPFDGLGTGRLIRDRRDPESAEVAVTVIDPVQRCGLGTVLLALLVNRARMLGITRLRAFVLPENDVVVRWLLRLGWAIVGEDGCLDFEAAAVADPEPTPAGVRFERLVEELRGPLTRCLDSIEQGAEQAEESPRDRGPDPPGGDRRGGEPRR